MSGAAHQGERNSPAYLPEVLQTLSQLRGQDAQYLAEQTSLNARQVLDLARWQPGTTWALTKRVVKGPRPVR